MKSQMQASIATLDNEAPTGIRDEEIGYAATDQPETNGILNSGVETATEPPAPKKNKNVRRASILLIVLALVAFGYVKRDTLKALVSGQTVESTAGDKSGSEARADLKVLYWVDPMHPNYKSDKPGKAPDCGMDLVPVYENGATPSTVPQDAFLISAEKQQLIGVTYGQVAYEPLSKMLRTVGRLAYDETKISHVHTKIDGWIEDVYVDFTGKQVSKGQPLLTVYSPDLLQSQQEYLLALRGRKELAESSLNGAAAASESLLESARRRLELWDITDAQIKELERTGKPSKALPIYAPASGYVLARNAYPKQRVMPDAELYTIADLSTIWVIADVYEYEAPEVALGQRADVTLTYFPGRTFTGKVTYIYPQVDATTRTLKVRVEIANPNTLLKPDMFANVELKIDYGKKLVVPQEAVLDSGSEQLVYIALDGGYFQPRRVQLGPKVDNRYTVLGGLKAGERIVTSGNFLVDSESRLKSAAGAMGTPGHNHGGAPAPGQADHSQHQTGGQPPAQAQPDRHSQHNDSAVETPGGGVHSNHQPSPGDHSQHQAKPGRKILYWTCVMHTHYRGTGPGKCPECKMDLVPKYADEK